LHFFKKSAQKSLRKSAEKDRIFLTLFKKATFCTLFLKKRKIESLKVPT